MIYAVSVINNIRKNLSKPHYFVLQKVVSIKHMTNNFNSAISTPDEVIVEVVGEQVWAKSWESLGKNLRQTVTKLILRLSQQKLWEIFLC